MLEQCCKFTQNNVATLLQPCVALQIVVASGNIALTSGAICLSDVNVHKICNRLILRYAAHNVVDRYFFKRCSVILVDKRMLISKGLFIY